MIPVPIIPAFAGPLAPLADSLEKAWRTRQIFRTETEARISVLNDGWFPTPAAKYWQCVREQTGMLEQLALHSFEVRRNEAKIAEFHAPMTIEQTIDYDECLFKREQLQRVGDDRIREILMWEKIKQELLAQDPTIDTENVDAHQLVSYAAMLVGRVLRADPTGMSEGEQVNLAGQFLSAVSRCRQLGVLDSVLAPLPIEQRQRVLGLESSGMSGEGVK